MIKYKHNKYMIFFILSVLLVVGILFAKKAFFSNTPIVETTQQNELTDADVQELTQVYNRLDTIKNLYMSGIYELYDASTMKLLETEPFIYAKENGNAYTMVGFVEQLLRGDHLVVIDNATQTVTIQDSVQKGLDGSIFKGFSLLKEMIDEKEDISVLKKTEGEHTVFSFKGDSLGFYPTSEISYNTKTLQLVSASMMNDVVVPADEENIEKKVLLKLVVQTYEDHPGTNSKHSMLNKKAVLVNKRILLTDSLNKYKIIYN